MSVDLAAVGLCAYQNMIGQRSAIDDADELAASVLALAGHCGSIAAAVAHSDRLDDLPSDIGDRLTGVVETVALLAYIRRVSLRLEPSDPVPFDRQSAIGYSVQAVVAAGELAESFGYWMDGMDGHALNLDIAGYGTHLIGTIGPLAAVCGIDLAATLTPQQGTPS